MRELSRPFTLSDLRDGAVEERFQLELEKVLANILDLNVTADKPRSITINVAFKPSVDRRSAAVSVTTSSKLVSLDSTPTQIFVARDKGKPVASEYDPKQLDLGFGEAQVAQIEDRRE